MSKKAAKVLVPDIEVGAGEWATMWSFRLNSEAAREWNEENVGVPDYMGSRESFYADHRPARDLVEAYLDEGFIVTLNGRQIVRK